MQSFKELSLTTGLVSLFLIAAFLTEIAHARPSAATMSRHKRTSDQRLAELETLIALENLRGKLVTVPVGFGKVDPAKIGRRRRSSVEFDLQRIRRFLQALGSQSESNSEDSSEEMILPSLLQNGEQHEDDIGNQLI